MTEDEQVKISELLETKWPKKFDAPELAVFVQKLAKLQFADVEKALVEHKLRTHYRPFPEQILAAVRALTGGLGGQQKRQAQGTGSVWADTLKAQWAEDGKNDTRGYNALECFCRYLRSWYGAKVLRHQRATERSRSDTNPEHFAAAGIALANDQLKKETDGLYRHAKMILHTDGKLTPENADALAKLVLGSRNDYETAMEWARHNCTVAVEEETALTDPVDF